MRANGFQFSETATTAVVNANGGLLLMHEMVLLGQVLTLHNLATKEEILCTVIDINTVPNGVPEVGVEFAESCPRFWRVFFPPADWTTRSAEAKRMVQAKAPGPAATKPAGPPLVKK